MLPYSVIKRILLLFVLSAIILQTSCSYKQKGEFYRDIPKPVAPQVTYSNSFNSDTLVSPTGSPFTVTINAGEKYKYYQLNIYLGDTVVYTGSTAEGVFSLSPGTIVHKAGIYELKFEFLIHTYSGSMADKIGVEAFAFTTKIFLVYFDLLSFEDPVVTFSSENGKLTGMVTDPQNGPPVRKIVVSKRFEDNPCWDIVTVTGSSPIYFTDDSYVGELAYYTVKTYLGNDEGTFFYPCTQVNYTKAKEIERGTCAVDQKGMPVIYWDKSIYLNNCGGYRIFRQLDQDSTFEEIRMVNDPDKDSIHDPAIGFPGTNKLYVSHYPKINSPGYFDNIAVQNFSARMDCKAGLPSFSFYRFARPIGNDIFTDNSFQDIFRYDATTLTQTDHISTNMFFSTFNVSPNNKYLLAAVGNETSEFILYNVITKTVTHIPAIYIMGVTPDAYVSYLSISDNGIGTVSSGVKLIIYDFLNHVKLCEKTFTFSPRPSISPNGQYFLVGADKLYLYKLSGFNATERWHSSGDLTPFKYYSFLPSDDQKVIIVENMMYSERNVVGMPVTNSFSVDITGVSNIDYNTGRLLGYNDHEFRIYDINTGSMLKTMPLGDGNGSDIKISGNNLFSTQGKTLILF